LDSYNLIFYKARGTASRRTWVLIVWMHERSFLSFLLLMLF